MTGHSSEKSRVPRPRPSGRRARWLYAAALIVVIAALWAMSSDPDGRLAGTGVSSPGKEAAGSADEITSVWDTLYSQIQADFESVAPLLKRGCFDCHSAQTYYPWYHNLPVVGGWIDGHIEDAREHLDMTDGFPFKGHDRPADDLLAIKDEITGGHMPPLYYRAMHWNARPSRAETDSIAAWIDRSLRLLAAHGQFPLNRRDLVPAGGE